MKNALVLPSLERLNELFAYDPETGIFTRRVATSNGDVGSAVGGKSGGYIILWVDGRRYRAHRIAWAMGTGVELSVDLEVDHRNTNKADNRLANLRQATSAQNIAAQGPRCNNTSGVRGVSFDQQTGQWRSRIEVNKRNISLGRHKTFDAAARARLEAERLYYGEFASQAA